MQGHVHGICRAEVGRIDEVVAGLGVLQREGEREGGKRERERERGNKLLLDTLANKQQLTTAIKQPHVDTKPHLTSPRTLLNIVSFLDNSPS